MSQRVVLHHLEAEPRALIKNSIFTLGYLYTENGDSFNPNGNVSENGLVSAIPRQSRFLVVGADSKKPYIVEPASNRRSGNFYNLGFIIDVFRSVTERAIVARPYTNLGQITIGEAWDPIDEVVETVIAENGFYIGSKSDASVVNLPCNNHLQTLNSTFEATVGKSSREASLVVQATLNVTRDLLGLRT